MRLPGQAIRPGPIPISDRPASTAKPAQSLQDAYARIIIDTDPDPSREGLHGTPERATKAMRELTSGYSIDPLDHFKTFPTEGDEMIIVDGIPFFSLCEHHLLPFFGEAHIAYLPDDRILGLSKFARIVDSYARRFQVQERLTEQIIEIIEEGLAPLGSMVVFEAEHLCMAMRGVQKQGSVTRTSAVRGSMKEKPEARAEALALIDRRRR